MAANSASGLQDINAWMFVREVDKFPYVDSSLVADKRQLVCKCNLHVAGRIFCKLAHFCGLAVSAVERTLYELAVEFDCLVGRLLVHTADYTVVVHELIYYIAGQYPFRTICNVDFVFKLRAKFENEACHLVSCSDRGG